MTPMEKAWVILKNAPRFEYLGTTSRRDIGLLHYPSSVTGKIRSMPFYRSSGVNSGEPGSWKFFHGVTTHPQSTEFYSGSGGEPISATPSKGWFIKPQVVGHAFEYDHSQGPRYGHAKIRQLSDWLNENVGDTQYQTQYMDGAEMNQLLRDKDAFGIHDMAQGIQESDY